MTITAQNVQALRQATGSGMMDAKRALEDAGGDIDAATKLLRERGLAAAAKRTERAQTEGAIGSYLHAQAGRPVIGVLVELASRDGLRRQERPVPEGGQRHRHAHRRRQPRLGAP